MILKTSEMPRLCIFNEKENYTSCRLNKPCTFGERCTSVELSRNSILSYSFPEKGSIELV